MAEPHHRNVHARRMFDGIARHYETPAQAFSLFQYGRWRRSLLSELRLAPSSLVLDVCTGTGLVAIEVAKQIGCRVVGVDLSELMVEQARRNLHLYRLTPLVSLLKGRAESLPFADGCFDTVVFTFLLRYVDDPQTTLGELTRVLRPGGQLASLDFYVPQNRVLHALWLTYTRLLLPSGTRLLGKGWRQAGSFLGPSISALYRKHALRDLAEMWGLAGIENVRTETLSLGGAVVMRGEKETHHEN